MIIKIIDTQPLWSGRLGKKVKGMRVKPLASVVSDPEIISKLLVNTLEAKEVLSVGACFCLGDAGDAWQQQPTKIIKDYDLTMIDAAGWLHFMPKPTKIVEFIEVTEKLMDDLNIPPAAPSFIVGKWGQTIDGIANLQRFRLGDFIARQRDDHTDQWVVAKAIWNRTYEEVFSK